MVGAAVGWIAAQGTIDRLILAVGSIIAALIVLSFTLGVGEVYQYEEYYRRAFFIFGDEVATLLTFFCLLALATKRLALLILFTTALAMTGGKTAIALYLIACTGLFWLYPAVRPVGIRHFILALLLAAPLYFSCSAIGNIPQVRELGQEIAALIETTTSVSVPPSRVADFANCQGVECLIQQAHDALRGRYISAVAGLWMTSNTALFAGNYPTTRDQFAALMMRHNPYGMNEHFHMTYDSWHWLGMPQNPYIHIGSAYGWGGLLALVFAVSLCGVYAVRALALAPTEAQAVYPLFYLTVALCNQTQIFFTPGSSILVAFAACGAYSLVLVRKSATLPVDLAAKTGEHH